MKKATVAALAVGVALATSTAFAQSEGNPSVTFCKDQLASVLGMHGMQLADMRDLNQIKVGKHQPSILTMGRPKQCKGGELRVTMWYTCTLQAIHTVGDCSIEGVSRSPF